MNLLHITTRSAWIEALRLGSYSPPSLKSEGFVHCSTTRQILQVAGEYYSGEKGLVLLVIDTAHLTAELRWELPSEAIPSAGFPQGTRFPHIYGPINVEAVVHVLDFVEEPGGTFKLPELLAREPPSEPV